MYLVSKFGDHIKILPCICFVQTLRFVCVGDAHSKDNHSVGYVRTQFTKKRVPGCRFSLQCESLFTNTVPLK